MQPILGAQCKQVSSHNCLYCDV